MSTGRSAQLWGRRKGRVTQLEKGVKRWTQPGRMEGCNNALEPDRTRMDGILRKVSPR